MSQMVQDWAVCAMISKNIGQGPFYAHELAGVCMRTPAALSPMSKSLLNNHTYNLHSVRL